MKKLKLSESQLQEITDTFDMNVEGMESFLNIETGEVVTLYTIDREEADEELSNIIEEGFNEIYFRIPEPQSYEGYDDMVDFAETVDDKKLHSALMSALNGRKGVFRRFKDALAADRLQMERYFRFVEERNRERVAEWLESIDVELEIIT